MGKAYRRLRYGKCTRNVTGNPESYISFMRLHKMLLKWTLKSTVSGYGLKSSDSTQGNMAGLSKRMKLHGKFIEQLSDC
jgi:hypothetical protein